MPDISTIVKNHIKDLRECLRLSEIKRIYNISIPHFALMLALTAKPFLVVEDSEDAAFKLYCDFVFFKSFLIKNSLLNTAYFPSPSNQENIAKRIKILSELYEANGMSIITSKDACQYGFQSTDTISLKKGGATDRNHLEEWLKKSGYKEVNIVMDTGEYSRRQWLFDIYPASESNPVRVEFFSDEIDVIKAFDIETQRSIREIDNMDIFPAEEGEQTNNLLNDLLGDSNFEVFICSEMASLIQHANAPIVFSHLPFEGEGINAGEASIAGLGILPQERIGIEKLAESIAKIGKKALAILPSEAQAQRLREILIESSPDMAAPFIQGSKAAEYEGSFCITIGRLSGGINIPDAVILTEKEFFGERPAYRPIKKSKVSRLLMSIDDIKPGDFVVHKDHGIGRFDGMQRQKTGDYEEDIISVSYANGKIYVPFNNIGKLGKYSAGEGHKPALDSLGSKNWQKARQKANKAVQEMAEKLLKLYAERKDARGFVFSGDAPMHREFDDFFPYEETPDQINAFNEIKKHMTSDTPMDMLLCGDVGYGKTEVAIKAAFRAVYDGKQVAVLVPTTLLAEQHFRTFQVRFSAFAVRIDIVSRFKSKKEIEKSLAAAACGETDIIIGTHILLGKKVSFNDLGLLIIDEEHKFGVAQKERLKELKKGVDVLTLTATPIPRTLHMSLSGIREMCTIETPPEERLAVRSIVTSFNAKTIQEAIMRELNREGQIFFVHNRISDIYETAGMVQKLAPDAKIEVAHGQMNESDLEKIMLRFFNHETDILVSTAIISSGLDITSANTIIINRADTFGLSDLYQLRGRVGRGNIQAYAYFLIAGQDIITDEAKKRLQAIQEMSYLGAGFRLALKDLEIRGAGNLLGPQQAGNIHRIGFDMYMDMLDKAVSELKGQKIQEEFDPQVTLRLTAFIPDSFISDISLRLGLYKKLTLARTIESVDELAEEMADRFGRLPQEVLNLLHIIKIKIMARALYIAKVWDVGGRYRFTFLSDSEGIYSIPENFMDEMLNSLLALQRDEKRLRLLQDGFELNTERLSQKESISMAESVLQSLWTRL
jgi:transcription-repair coupling factor (superfamily II helicase)